MDVSSEVVAFKLGEVLQTKNGFVGICRYIGNVEFASGIWVGLELYSADGKNNGSVNGKQYFSCRTNHGLFAKQNICYRMDYESSNVRLQQIPNKSNLIVFPLRLR